MVERPGTWAFHVAPIIAKLEIAAKFDQKTCFNADGSAALSKLLKNMAKIIDHEIEASSPKDQPQ